MRRVLGLAIECEGAFASLKLSNELTSEHAE